jgi:NhaP-type Na+/H+ or K+/H+ antiporter
MIFVISGIVLGFDAITSEHVSFENLGKTFLLYIFLTVTRQVLLVIFYPLMKLTGYPLELSHTALLTWGALRGALGMFLSLVLRSNAGIDPAISGIILFHTSFIALLTLIVNGLTTGIVVEKLGLSKESAIEKKFMWMFIEQVSVVQQNS